MYAGKKDIDKTAKLGYYFNKYLSSIDKWQKTESKNQMEESYISKKLNWQENIKSKVAKRQIKMWRVRVRHPAKDEE